MFAYLRNLSFYLSLLLLMVVYCILCGGVYAVSSEPSVKLPSPSPATNKNSVEFLQVGNVNIALKKDGNNEGKNIFVKDYYSPFLVSAGDVLLALVGVNSTNDNNDKNVTIISKYIVTKKGEKDWGSKVVSVGDSKDEWKSQFAAKGELKEDQTSVVKGMLATAKESKIYLLLVNCSDTNGDAPNNDAKCDLNITMGTVGNGETQNGKKITWDDGKLDNTINFKDLIKKGNQKLYPFGGTAFVTAENKVVFVVLIANEKKNIVAVIYSEEGAGTETKFKASKVENVDGCTPFFFPWEDKIIMIPTHCTEEGKNQKVKESTDTGSRWSNSTGRFARLLGFMQDKSNFTTTKINGSNILLFTQKISTLTENTATKNDAHVWFSDGNRVKSAGRIVTDDNITSASLLHTNDELFALHQNWDDKGQKKNITLTRMEDQLKDITNVVVAWNTNDNAVKNMFKDTLTTSEASCFTEGLVGFLHNTTEGNGKWIDEYFFTNATVTKGNKVNYGFNFDKAGAGAKWPVGKKKENQPYNFTDSGFTLVANVTVDSVVTNGKDNSVVGLVYKEGSNAEKTVGLWCTAEGEWKVTLNGDNSKKILSKKNKCQRGSAYFVVFLLNNGELSVHIDGEELGESGKMKIEKTDNITHFYFGADINDQTTTNADVVSHVTVENVLLYNCPFTKEEVEKLKIPKETKSFETTNDSLTNTKGDNKNNTREGNKTPKDKSGDGGSPSQSSRSREVEEKSTSQPESSTVRSSYVGVFVCFVMLAHALCFL